MIGAAERKPGEGMSAQLDLFGEARGFCLRVDGWLRRLALLSRQEAHTPSGDGSSPVWCRLCGQDTAALVGATVREFDA